MNIAEVGTFAETGLASLETFLLEHLEEAVIPPSKEQWKETSTRITALATKVAILAGFYYIRKVVGALLLIRLALNAFSFTRQKEKTAFDRVLENGRFWEEIDTKEMHFPKPFLWGVSTSEYQSSGAKNCPDSHWASFERENLPVDNRSGRATDLWNTIDKHIALAKGLGVNSFRLSVEWSKIEPRKGEFDQAALEHYVTFVKKLKEAGITPMVTLLHFSLPQWLENEGGILAPDFVSFITRFTERVVPALKPHVQFWNTINEPEVQAFMGYLLGEFPPKKHSVSQMGEGLKSLLQAHCQMTRVIKKADPQAEVGLVHDVIRYKPYHWWHPLEWLVAKFLTKITHETVCNFLKSGKFEFKIPFLANSSFEDKEITRLTTMNGVNFYSRPLLKQVFSKEVLTSACYPGEQMLKMRFREDPQGIYEAVQAIYKADKKKIFITETGISTEDPEQFDRYYRRSLYSVYKAMQDGVDIRGYFAWSLARNSEWAEGWNQHNYGLYDYDKGTKEFTLRQGALAYKEIIGANT